MRFDKFTIKAQEGLQRAQTPSRSRARKIRAWLAFGASLVLVSGSVRAEELSFSAKVDKTAVNVGEPISLTVTLSGDAAGAKLPPLQLPDGFAVVAQTQATNFSIRAGAAERSVVLQYVLVSRQAGSFQLGPFELTHQQRTVKTEPIGITVKKPAVPPNIRSSGERFTL